MTVVRFPKESRVPELWTLKELCEVYQLSERYFRYRVKEGMPHKRYGNRLRFEPRDVRAWMDEHA